MKTGNKNNYFAKWYPVYLIFFSLVLIIFPGSAQSQNQSELDRARSLLDLDRIGQAQKLYRSLSERNPTSPEAHEGWLRTSIRLGDWQEGQQALKNYNNISPDGITPVKLGSKLYFRQEKYDTALQWAQRYRSRAPGKWLPYHFLARIYLKTTNYFQAEKMIESAQLRTPGNQWVDLDEISVKYRTDRVSEAQNLADKLTATADNPTVFWLIARMFGNEYSKKRLQEILRLGGEFLPGEDPPFIRKVDPADYRYWWARMNYIAGDTGSAESILPAEMTGFRTNWLQSQFEKLPEDRLNSQREVLDRWPDNLPAQWLHATLARRSEDINGRNRKKASQYFYDEYGDIRYLNFNESALTALIRSLELNPLREEEQFELATYFDNRGWNRLHRDAAERANTLGFDPPSKTTDYLEGLGDSDTSVQEPPAKAKIGISVDVKSPWMGPLYGKKVLRRMIRHNFFHQPAFEVRSSEAPLQVPLSKLVLSDTLDGGIDVSISEWSESISATVEYQYPDGSLRTEEFYDFGEMKLWRLVDTLVETIKKDWPWRGNIYEMTEDGGWVNLGKVHGLSQGDTLTLVNEDLFDNPPEVGKIEQSKLRIDFPSPYFSTEIRLGTTVKK